MVVRDGSSNPKDTPVHRKPSHHTIWASPSDPKLPLAFTKVGLDVGLGVGPVALVVPALALDLVLPKAAAGVDMSRGDIPMNRCATAHRDSPIDCVLLGSG